MGNFLFWTAQPLIVLLCLLYFRNMRGQQHYRKYFFLSLYVGFSLITGLVFAVHRLDPSIIFPERREYVQFYWWCESLEQLLIFALMLSLIYRASEGLRHHLSLTALTAVVSLAITGLSVVLVVPFDAQTYTKFMTLLTRNLSFCSALLNFLLWSLLIRRQKRDFQLMLLGAGIGMLTTGKAIGHSLRVLAIPKHDNSLVVLGNTIVAVGVLLSLAIWYFCFRKPARQRKEKFVPAELVEVK